MPLRVSRSVQHWWNVVHYRWMCCSCVELHQDLCLLFKTLLLSAVLFLHGRCVDLKLALCCFKQHDWTMMTITVSSNRLYHTAICGSGSEHQPHRNQTTAPYISDPLYKPTV